MVIVRFKIKRATSSSNWGILSIVLENVTGFDAIYNLIISILYENFNCSFSFIIIDIKEVKSISYV